MEQTDRVKAWPIAKAAWGGVLRAFGRNPLTFILAIALFAAFGAAMAGLGPLPKLLFRPQADKTAWANGATYAGMRLGVAFISSLILAPLLVAVHRTLLKDRVRAGWLPATAGFFLWFFVLQAAAVAGFSFALLASAVAFVRGLIDLIVQIAILILMARLALLAPAVAIGVPAKSAEARIDASWTAMEGRFWLFVRVILFTLLPMLLLLFALSKLGLPKPPNPPPISVPPPAPLPVTKLLLIGRGLMGAVEAFTWALFAAAMSELYARLKPKG